MKKHKNKLLVLAGFALLLAVVLILPNRESVLGKQAGQPSSASVKTV